MGCQDEKMTATASDYAWFEDDSGLAESYCVTLARGLTPSGFLLRIGAQAAPPLTPELLEESTYTCGIAPVPPSESPAAGLP
jgi:Family of unknown function (DUF6461)